jgi:phosphoribosyl 1,2-cyclic phosphodiesterase
MSLHVRALASGSSGNAFLARTPTSAFLIDAGLSARALERLMRQQRVEPSALTAIVLSHEHHDHAQGAGPLARRYGIPIVCTAGTAAALSGPLQGVEVLRLSMDGLTIGDADLWSFPVPHDAAEPVGVLLRHSEWTLGVALDFGHMQPGIVEALRLADLIVVEANHDREKLLATAYPWSTKHRIMSDRGHLSNLQAAELLHAVAEDARRRHIWLAHLSQQANDHPRGVVRKVLDYLEMFGTPPQTLTLDVAQRDLPSAAWHSDQSLWQGDLFCAL